MKAHRAWSYAPYRPPFTDCGSPYVCRVAPAADRIRLEWLPDGSARYRVFYRLRGTEEYRLAGTTADTAMTVTGLTCGETYECYVEGDRGRSRVRLARCGAYVDTMVNYLHPEDLAYDFSGRYLCSPSLVRHPDGFLLASMDLFAPQYPQNLTLIFRSDDDGATWHYQTELFPCFWGKLFCRGREVYMLAVSTEYGDLLLGRSDDGGRTFSEPAVLLRGSGGKNGEAGVHKNPQTVLRFGGRIWNTLEWGSWGRGYHAPMVMSAPEDCDLMDPDNWRFSEPVRYDPTWPGVAEGPSTGNIEGALVAMHGGLYNVMRYDMSRTTPNYGRVLAYRVDPDHPEAPLRYDHAIAFPANYSKFEIRYDEKTGKYWSIASRILDGDHTGDRNLLSLMVSGDGEHWRLDRDLIDRRQEDPTRVGFQYVDFFTENGKAYYLCRTAMNGAHSFHDSNCITFGTVIL